MSSAVTGRAVAGGLTADGDTEADGADEPRAGADGDALGEPDALAEARAEADAGVETDAVAEADASGVGSRWAILASHSTSRNGPAPTGCVLNGASASDATGTSRSKCCWSDGCVAAWRNPPSGVPRSNRTVRSSSAATLTSLHEVPPGPLKSGSWSV